MLNLNTSSGTGGDAMGDSLRNIELIWGSTQADVFVASAGADVIHGDGGSDTVSYEASKHGVNVELNNGQYGDDPATTETEDDVFFAATDTIVNTWRSDTSTGRPGPVQATDTDPTTRSYAEGDILASIENVIGSQFADRIIGQDDVPNVIMGGGGNDTLGGNGGNDKLHGDAGNDKLYGDDGDDTLVGGGGDDDMTGGGGNDTFVFGPGNGNDVIINIEVGTAATATSNRAGDSIDLRAFGIDADDLPGLLSERAGNVIVNLEDYGGGRITIQDQTIEGLGLGDDDNLVSTDTNGAGDGIFIV